VALLRRSPPDLVLTDLSMPGLDGFEVLVRMRRDPRLRDVPAIVVTGRDEVASAAACIEQGAEDYVVKPYNPTLLQARIRASLERRSLRLQEHELTRRLEEYALELEQALRSTQGGAGTAASRALSDLGRITARTGGVRIEVKPGPRGRPAVALDAPGLPAAEVDAVRARIEAALGAGDSGTSAGPGAAPPPS
jgi:CheY-like chemotaxis protein